MPFLGGRGQSSKGFFGGGTTPDAPTSLSSTPGNGQLSIDFVAPTFDGGLPITNYEWSINAGSTWTAFSPTDIISPVVITGLTNGTAYTVYLRAVNSLGSGKTSAALSTNTTPYTVPTAPTSLSSTAGNTQLTISFTVPSTNGGNTITNYEYALSINSGSTYGPWTPLSPLDAVSPITITGLTNGQAYYVKLRAVTALTTGNESTPVTTNTMPFTTPTAPTSLISTPGDTQLSIAFTAPSSSGGPAITNYEYALSTNSGSTYAAWTALSPSDATSPIVITGLTNGTAYYVKLRAITSLAIGAESLPVTTNTAPFTSPTAPTSLSSTAGNTQLTIAFTAPTSNGGFAITNYEYALSTNGGSTYSSWTALSPTDAITPVTITGLTNGQSYYVKLRAITSVANGAESVAVTTNTMPFTTPTAPTSLSSTAGNTQLVIAFTAPSSTGGPAITNYEYALSTNSGTSYGTWTALSPVDPSTPITITGLTNGQAYYVKLRAITSLATGDESVAVTANTMPFTTPAPPTALSSIASNAQLSISFTAGSSGGPAITNYQYALSTNSGTSYGAWTALSPADAVSPITIGSLTNGTAYYVKLRAITSLAIGTESLAVTTNTTPYTTAAAPTIGTVTASVSTPSQVSTPTMTEDKDNATFTWTAPSVSGIAFSVAFTAASNGGSAFTDYQYSTDNGATFKSAGTTSSPLTITTLSGSTSALASATAYNIRIRAVTSLGGAGTASSVSANTTKTAITAYKIRLYNNRGTEVLDSTPPDQTGLSYSKSHFHVAADWSVTVAAANDNGTGTYSAESGQATGWALASCTNLNPTGCDSCGSKSTTCSKWTRTGETDGPCDISCGTETGCSDSWSDVTASGTYDGVAYTAYSEYFTGTVYMYKNDCPTGNVCAGGCTTGSIYEGYKRFYCAASTSYRITNEGCHDSRTK